MRVEKVYAIELTRTGKAKIHKMNVPSGMTIDYIVYANCGANARNAGWAIADINSTLPLCKKCFKKST